MQIDELHKFSDGTLNDVRTALDDRLKAQAENEEFLNNLDENIQNIIKEQVKEQVKVQVSKILPKIEKTVNEQLEAKVLSRSSNLSKTSYVMAAGLSEMELKKILIEKIESNKSIYRSDEQRNLYKALVDAYESNKIILDTYGDIVTLKRRQFETGVADDQPIAEASQHPEWFQQQKKPTTFDCAWNKNLPATLGSIQPWISDLAKQADSLSLFNGLMDTLSLVELEFFLEEVYKATTDQLDWNNPEGQQYPHNLLKPLPLIPNSRGRHVIPFDHFINNDLEYLRGCASNHKYTTFVTKTEAADYGYIKWIEDLSTGSLLEMSTQNGESSLSPNFRSSNGMITSIWIGSLKADKSHSRRMLCFQRLSKNVHKKHRHPTACGRSSNKCRKLPKEAQPHKARYNGLTRIDELHKLSDGTLNDVRTALDSRLKGIRMKYLPQAIWRKSDKERAAAMIQAIDKQLKMRKIMRSLEKFVGGRLYEGDFRMLQRTI
nr:hypothetical protein [Tanacetum cinerariifolium]